MTDNRKYPNYEIVEKLIGKGSLHDAFTLLRKTLKEIPASSLSYELDNLEETYRYMMHYLVEGYSDSGRMDMLSDITSKLHRINDSILRECVLVDSPDIYSSTKRFENLRESSLQSRLSDYKNAHIQASLAENTEKYTDFRKKEDEALAALFSYVWTMYGSPASDYRVLSDALTDGELPFSFKAQMISALMLGNMSYYDSNGLNTLLDIYEADLNQKISARSLVAILFVIAGNAGRVADDRNLKQRLLLWQDSIINYRRLREIVMNVIRTRDTERISSKMQNEVLPELMKLRPEILKHLKNVSEESDLEMLDVNPEWEELLNKNGLGDKLKELTEMQMDGGDVMMVAFSNLKSFPFFNSVPNWFLPFSSSHSEIKEVSKDFKSFNDMLNMDGVMCDSDKYSFAFSLTRMPEIQRQMISSRMDEQMNQLKEAIADRSLKSSVPEFDSEVTRYVRDIYRFFKLFRKKEDFADPFADPLNFMSLPYLSDVIADMEVVNLVGEFYFKRGYYEEALPLLELSEKESENPHLLWEKIGYAYNALGNTEEAIKWYRKAELLNPDSIWLIKQLAVCYRMVGNYAEAAEYYGKALESDPENYSLLMSAGNCLLESGDSKGAVSYFYHADYLKPGKDSTRRSLAWAEFLNGNHSKSMELYDHLISGKPRPSDFLNRGHIHFIKGEYKSALNDYKGFVKSPDGSIARLEQEIAKDIEELKKSGCDPEVMHLLIEKLRYDL